MLRVHPAASPSPVLNHYIFVWELERYPSSQTFWWMVNSNRRVMGSKGECWEAGRGECRSLGADHWTRNSFSWTLGGIGFQLEEKVLHDLLLRENGSYFPLRVLKYWKTWNNRPSEHFLGGNASVWERNLLFLEALLYNLDNDTIWR